MPSTSIWCSFIHCSFLDRIGLPAPSLIHDVTSHASPFYIKFLIQMHIIGPAILRTTKDGRADNMHLDVRTATPPPARSRSEAARSWPGLSRGSGCRCG